MYKSRQDFANDADYIQYMKQALEPGLRVKMLCDWYGRVGPGRLGTVTSSVYTDGFGRDRVKVQFDSGPSDFEVMCWVVEIVN